MWSEKIKDVMWWNLRKSTLSQVEFTELLALTGGNYVQWSHDLCSGQ